MTETSHFSLTTLANEPIKHISTYWLKRNTRREQLIKTLWNLHLEMSAVNYKQQPEDPHDYKVTFSPFLGSQRKHQKKSPSEMVKKIVDILQEYGWDSPHCIHVLNNFKCHLESVSWKSDEILVIKNKNRFHEGCSHFYRELHRLLVQEWTKKTLPFWNAIEFIEEYLLIPLSIFIFFGGLLILIPFHQTFVFIQDNYEHALNIWTSVFFSLWLTVITLAYIRRKMKP